MVAKTPAVLLVGGLGTRLRSVLPTTPKPLAPLGKLSFLELLIRQLRSQGVSRVVLCTGHLADQIEREFGDGRKWNLTIEYSREPQPLGTAGAVKLAGRYLNGSSEFLVMNGDSFLEVDLGQLIQLYRRRHCLVTMAAVQVSNAGRYGTLQTDSNGRLIGFLEKTGSDQPGLINAGVYVFNHEILNCIPDGPASLEKDVFPHILNKGVYVQVQSGMFIDIGTPEDYVRAQELCDRLYAVAGSGSKSG
jgi:NDP-sugar pyrophosphorylase family protein